MKNLSSSKILTSRFLFYCLGKHKFLTGSVKQVAGTEKLWHISMNKGSPDRFMDRIWTRRSCQDLVDGDFDERIIAVPGIIAVHLSYPQNYKTLTQTIRDWLSSVSMSCFSRPKTAHLVMKHPETKDLDYAAWGMTWASQIGLIKFYFLTIYTLGCREPAWNLGVNVLNLDC